MHRKVVYFFPQLFIFAFLVFFDDFTVIVADCRAGRTFSFSHFSLSRENKSLAIMNWFTVFDDN